MNGAPVKTRRSAWRTRVSARGQVYLGIDRAEREIEVIRITEGWLVYLVDSPPKTDALQYLNSLYHPTTPTKED